MQTAGQFSDRTQSMLHQIVTDPLIDLAAYQRIVKQRRSDPDRASAGDEKLQSIFGAAYPALTDDGDVVWFADLIYLMYLEQGHGFDGGPG